MSTAKQGSGHLDNKIKTLSITPLTRRKGLSPEQFNDYWKDIHGPVCSRLPYLGMYIQHHLKGVNPDLLPLMRNADQVVLPENNWDGFAEIGFFSGEEMEKWLPTTTVLFDDEQNVFDKTVAHYCQGSSFTLKDHSDSINTNGTDGRQFIYLFIRKRVATAQAEAVSYLTDHFLPAFTSSAQVSRVRYHVLQEHDNSQPNPPAPNVEHFMAEENQHQFVVELAFDSKLSMMQFFQQRHFQDLMPTTRNYYEVIHPFESDGRYTMVYDGTITLAGLRGSTNALLIEKVGAINQIKANVMQLMLSGTHQ